MVMHGSPESKKEQSRSIGSLENTSQLFIIKVAEINVRTINSNFNTKIRGIIRLIKKQTKSTSKKIKKKERDNKS